MKLPTLTLVPLTLALAIALTACGSGSASNQAAPVAPEIPVSVPIQQSVPIMLELPGHVEAAERVELRSRLSGHIAQIAFSEGARVRKGQLLVRIDDAPYAAALASAEASLRQAEAEASLLANEAARARRLADQRAIAIETAERRQAEAAIASARRDGALAAVKRARLDLAYTRISAPIDGRIGRAEVTSGNLVGPEHRLAVIVSDQRLYVHFDVPESALANAGHEAWQASFTLPELPKRVFDGGIAFVENEINDGTGTVRARMALAGDEALVPGRYGLVRLKVGERAQALLIDETTLGADQGSRFVLVVGDDNTVQYRPVQLGPKIGDKRVIEQGLSASDRVVVAGLMGVRPGMTVSPRDLSPAPAAGPQTTAAAMALQTE